MHYQFLFAALVIPLNQLKLEHLDRKLTPQPMVNEQNAI